MTSLSEGITYPPGVKDFSEDISTDDLVRRLKECAKQFQNMAQDEGSALRYESLAHLLISERFLEHRSQDVRLLVACCIADIFRVSAPDAPYKDESQIKMVLEFFIEQLKGLSSSNNPSYKCYFYLLENLSVVKTFNICFDLQGCQRIICNLFKLMFKIISDHPKFQRIILDLLCPLINEADLVPGELVNIILNHIVEPMKSQNKNACMLAQEILRKTASSIGTYVQAYFTNEFYLGKPTVSERLCDLIYELNCLNSSMMAFVIPQLEGKLKSSDERERLLIIKLVAKMFSDKKSNMIEENVSLWTNFLSRFTDISAKVRVLCLKFAGKFLVHHPDSRKSLTEILCSRSLDGEEEVRCQAVLTILSAAKEDITCVSEELLRSAAERARDRKFSVRKEALLGLAKLYKQYILDSSYVDPVTEEKLSFIKSKILHQYYQLTLDDKYLVERVLHTCFIPFHSHMEKRIKLLYQFYCTIDYKAMKSFKDILKHQKNMRSLTIGLLETIQQKTSEKKTLLEQKITSIAKSLKDPRKSIQQLSRFCRDLEKNIKLRSVMSLLLTGNVSCSEAEIKVKEVLRFLGEPVMTNSYYMTIKSLLERVVPVLLDKESVKYLVNIAKNSILEDGIIEAELKLKNSGPRGMDLINAITHIYPHYFDGEEVFASLVEILDSRQDDVEISEFTLEALSQICKDLENNYPQLFRVILPICQKLIRTGTPKQAKYSVKTVHEMVNDKEAVFGEIIESLQEHFTMKSQYFRTALVSIGHIAFLCHDMFASQFKYIVAQTIVRDMLMKDHDLPRGGEDLWGELESLPEETKIKIQGLKVMVRWLMGLKDMVQPAVSTFKLLNAVLENKGDLMQKNVPGPKENSWMRLSAASCFLKLCRIPNYTTCLQIEFFLNLAYVINDPCPEVRDRFTLKVHKGLSSFKLPMEFIAILAIAGLDPRIKYNVNSKNDSPEKILLERIKLYLQQNIVKRRSHVKENSISSDELPHHWPDYALPLVVYLLAHAPFFTAYNDLNSLHKIKDCLQLFITELIYKNEDYSFAFCKRLLENIKQTKDKLEPDNESRNLKLYAVCDLALIFIMSQSNFVLRDFPGQPKLSSKFFTEPDKSYSNMLTYLPPEMLKNVKVARSGFVLEIYNGNRQTNAPNNSTAATSQEDSLPSATNENITPNSEVDPIPSTSTAPDSEADPIPSTSTAPDSDADPIPSTSTAFVPPNLEDDPIPSTSKAPVPPDSKKKVVTRSTDSNSSVSQSNVKTVITKHCSGAPSNSTKSCQPKKSGKKKSKSKRKVNIHNQTSDASPNSTGSCEPKQPETIRNPSEANSQAPSISDVASESQKQSESSNATSSVTNSNNEDISHSESISVQSETAMDEENVSSVEDNDINSKSKNTLVSKKKCLPKRTMANRKSTRSSLKDKAPSSSCSEYSKQNGVLPPSPSSTSVDSLYPSDYENLIKPCYVVLEKIEKSSSNCNGDQNGDISFKRKHNAVDLEDYSSNQGSSAGSNLSEEVPRKRGRPPKKTRKINQELSTLPTNKRMKLASTSTDLIQSSRSSSRTAVSPTKPVVINGKLPKEKKTPIKSKVNNSHSSNSKKINSNALREELTAEINEIYNKQNTSTKIEKSKPANEQQNKKINGMTTKRRR